MARPAENIRLTWFAKSDLICILESQKELIHGQVHVRLPWQQ
jgi:hypothetical protein